MCFRSAACLLIATLGAAAAGADDSPPFEAVDLSAPLPPAALVARLAHERVVFVGETHTRYADHLNQLHIIERLFALDPNIALGVEYFQQRFQPQVDDYVAGRTTERQFLRETEYFERWGYDYRLYAPIFRFARERHMPVIALNVPSSLPSAVAKVGLDGLSDEQRAELPRQIEPASDAYKARLRAAFQAHGAVGPGTFEHFVEAQLVWDEGMAESAAAYLNAHPDRRMVILSGSGHVEFGSGIPRRLARRTNVSYAIVLSADGDDIEPKMADYLLLGEERELPPAGRLGVGLEYEDGRCRIRSVTPGGAAQLSGLEAKDVIVAIDGSPVETVADVRLALWDKPPGEHVHVDVRRKRLLKTVERAFDVELSAPRPSGRAADSNP
jgi:uncharacterized iron-regulated protein